MLKKSLFSLILCISANVFCFDRSDFTAEKIMQNDKVQSVAAGAVSAYARPIIVNFFKKDPIRAGAISTIIFLAHGLNIFRNEEDRPKRFISTVFGAATTVFIRNK